MTPIRVRSGRSFTVTSTEQAIDVEGPYGPGGYAQLTIELLSGSYQYATAFENEPPVIDSNYTTIE